MSGKREPDPRSGLDVAGEWSPAFEGQRPPFEAGNGVAIRHGGYGSTLKLAPRAAEIADELRAVAPGYSPSDEAAVRLLGLTLARLERANNAMDAVDEAGDAIAAYLGETGITLARLRDDLRAWAGLARRLANDLGLTPTSRARLGLDVARTGEALNELAEVGRQIRLAREGNGE